MIVSFLSPSPPPFDILKAMSTTTSFSIADALAAFIDNVALSRSANTARAYANALAVFSHVLHDRGLPPHVTPINRLGEEAIGWFAAYLKNYAPASEQLYLVAASQFYNYLVAEELADVNLQRLHMITRARARRPGARLPQFPREDIEKVIAHAQTLAGIPHEDHAAHLRDLRDRAFILVLADTGLRVHEICNLRRGDIDWNEGKALIIGKGDRQALVRFSSRALKALRDYLNARAQLDGASSRPLPSLPMFARHDRGAGKKVKPITTATGRNIIKDRVRQALGPDAAGKITPHSFRHYFVTTVLQGSGGNLKLAQELARHKNIQVTQRYAHLSDDELDRGYHEIFEE